MDARDVTWAMQRLIAGWNYADELTDAYMMGEGSENETLIVEVWEKGVLKKFKVVVEEVQ